ncbi:phospholipase D family protein [Proteinivorax tanatarense]|uniref:Phospholipase D family protein n=1 Tax=Proteinivorax tanatarense TaxID=1260629 RepID=A0AAU7VL83_9FIRM
MFIFGVLIFAFYDPIEWDYYPMEGVERFYGEVEGPDRVVLVEDRYKSGLARLDLITNAEETLDISYYTFHEGTSLDIFLASVLDAADRGVEVRIMLDGLFHNLRGDLKDVFYVFYQHPNIELRLYEPLNLIKPWTLNNRLHDKFIIVDGEKVLLGGRNIGDKYFAPDPEKYDGLVSNDRDVLVINTEPKNNSNSVVYEVKDYFELLWEHQYTQQPIKELSDRQKRKGNQKEKNLLANLEMAKEKDPQRFEKEFDWLEKSYPTNQVSLTHNPLTRFNKEPWVWKDITQLMERAEHTIFIQSPYLIPTTDMYRYLEPKQIDADIEVLTNSVATSSNYFAMSGHIRNRKKIVDLGADVFEYQGEGTVHAKSYIFDNRISMVGSFNLDFRSTFLSTETMLVIDSPQFAEHLKKEVDNYISDSLLLEQKDYDYAYSQDTEKKEVPWLKKIVIKLLSIIMYFFDFML